MFRLFIFISETHLFGHSNYDYVKEHTVSSVLVSIQLFSVAKVTAEVQEETVTEPVKEGRLQETSRGSGVSLGGSSFYF